MFKFNNNHIFTGYLKQLLASFNLPKCRVYTKELEKQQAEYETNIQGWKIALEEQRATETELKTTLANNLTQINDKTITAEELATLKTERVEKLKDYAECLTKICNLDKLILNYPNIIPTTYHSKYLIYPNTIPENLPPQYPAKMRYAPYLKDGYLQVYTDGAWHNCHTSFDGNSDHSTLHKNANIPYTTIPYTYGQKILNYTKNLQIQNTVYDSYTHEYLGDYLRFHRDFANINLMPLYNCFSNRACPHLDISFTIGNNYEVKFKTDQSFETALYKYYMVPVKFFKDYTIAIDSSASIEVCCCIYDEYHNKDEDFSDIPKLTYQCFGDLQFKTPVLYTKLQNLNKLLLDPSNEKNDLCQQEDNLKLILKIPANNNSSIVILEGDYTRYNDIVTSKVSGDALTDSELSLLLPTPTGTETWEDVSIKLTELLTDPTSEVSTLLTTLVAEKSEKTHIKVTNKTVINYQKDLEAWKCLTDKLITPLQLLRTNTGESYPFADRLVEYLVGNAITVNEEIQDNVVRAKTVISKNCEPNIYSIIAEDGIWEPILQCLIYDYINENHDTHDINHDILGFIDKDVEKWYATKNNNVETTIANVDIYKDQWRD
jgi:hypothetical protein